MKFKLIPREKKFFILFKQQAENLKNGMEALQDLVDNYVEIGEKHQKIKEIEHQGDVIIHDIITKLRETFVTPLDREDIHALATGLDDVLDCIEGVASRLYYFKIEEPTPELRQLVDIIDKAVNQIYEAVSHLEKLQRVHTFCREIHNLEVQADEISRKATAALFETAGIVEEIKNLIKLKEIYARLETASDRCEDVANVIEGIAVKSA